MEKQLVLPGLCSNAYVKVKRSFSGLESWHNSYEYLLFLQRTWIRVSVSTWQLTTVCTHVLDTYSYMQIQNSDIKLINLKTFKNDLSWYFFKENFPIWYIKTLIWYSVTSSTLLTAESFLRYLEPSLLQHYETIQFSLNWNLLLTLLVCIFSFVCSDNFM